MPSPNRRHPHEFGHKRNTEFLESVDGAIADRFQGPTYCLIIVALITYYVFDPNPSTEDKFIFITLMVMMFINGYNRDEQISQLQQNVSELEIEVENLKQLR